MRPFETRTRVRYAETDAAGIVYYGSYFVYFELGRIEMFRELGLRYDRHLPIAETRCRYRASARFDDALRIVSWVAKLRSKGFVIASRVERVDDEGCFTLLAEGETGMVTVDEQGCPTELPDVFKKALQPVKAKGGVL